MLGISVVLRWNHGKYPRKYQIQDTRHQTWPTFEAYIKYVLLVYALNTLIETISFAVFDLHDELISRQTLVGQKLTSGYYLQCNRRIKPDRKPKPIPTQGYYPQGYLGKEVSLTTTNICTKHSLAVRIESFLENTFSMAISSMSWAEWLGEEMKCSAAVVGLDLELGLSMVRRSFKLRLVSPLYCKLQRLHWIK